MSPGTSFGPQECVASFSAAAQMLDVHSAGLDEINVFPVADRDTGRNMAASMHSLASAVDGVTRFSDISDATRAAALDGARGNSGLILGQFLVGFTAALVNTERADASAVGFAFEDAAVAARRTMPDPAEGTMLTIAEAVAAAAIQSIDRGDDAAALMNVVADAAVAALELTPTQLPILEEHGVVDAGAAGLCVVLEAMAAIVNGDDPGSTPTAAPAEVAAPLVWEVMFGIDADENGADRLRILLDTLGDSVGVAGGPVQWSCHVHCTDIGAVIEAALSVGRPRGIRVEPSVEGR